MGQLSPIAAAQDFHKKRGLEKKDWPTDGIEYYNSAIVSVDKWVGVELLDGEIFPIAEAVRKWIAALSIA